MLTQSAGSSERYTAFGLQELAVLGRVARVSALLRAAGVGTEYLLGLSEPTYFAKPLLDEQTDAHQKMTLQAYKDSLVLADWNRLPEEKRTAEKLAEMQGQLTRETFMVSARAMDTSMRMIDLAQPELREELFAKYNRHFIKPGQLPFDSTNPADVRRFLTEQTIQFAGSNLAKIHALGLACKYPNEQNITALGSLIDTDSFHGEPLDIGDEPITVRDVYQDFREVYSAISQTALALGGTEDGLELTQTFLSAYRMQFKQSKNDQTPITEQDIVTYAMSQLPVNINRTETIPQMESYIFANLVTAMYEDHSPFDIDNELELFDYWLECNANRVQELLDSSLESLLDNSLPLAIQDLLDVTDPNDIDLEGYMFDENNDFNFQSLLGGYLHVATRVLLLEEYAKELHQVKQMFVRKVLCYSLGSSDSLSDAVEKVVAGNKERVLQSVARMKFKSITDSKKYTIADHTEKGGLVLATQSVGLAELVENLQASDIRNFSVGLICEKDLQINDESEQFGFDSAKYQIPVRTDTQWVEVITDSGLLDVHINTDDNSEQTIVKFGPALSYFAVVEWDRHLNPPAVLLFVRSNSYKTQILSGETRKGLEFLQQFVANQLELFPRAKYWMAKPDDLDKQAESPRIAV